MQSSAHAVAQHGLVQSSPQAALAPVGHAFASVGHAAFLGHFSLVHSAGLQFAASSQRAGVQSPLSAQSRVSVDEQPTMRAEMAMAPSSANFFILKTPCFMWIVKYLIHSGMSGYCNRKQPGKASKMSIFTKNRRLVNQGVFAGFWRVVVRGAIWQRHRGRRWSKLQGLRALPRPLV